MNKNLIDKLVKLSYTQGELNSRKVFEIAEKLSKTHLRKYIKALKVFEGKNNLVVTTSFIDGQSQLKLREDLKNKFPNKNIIVSEDESLIGGVQIVNDDNIYELSIREAFQDIIAKEISEK